MNLNIRLCIEELERIESPVSLACLSNQAESSLPVTLLDERREFAKPKDFDAVATPSPLSLVEFDATSTTNGQRTSYHASQPVNYESSSRPYGVELNLHISDKNTTSGFRDLEALFLQSTSTSYSIETQGISALTQQVTFSLINWHQLTSTSDQNVLSIANSVPPGGGGESGSSTFVDQSVPINADNDHGAAIVQYQALDNQGNPMLDENDQPIYYPGHVPVNYEYDYKFLGYTQSENDLVPLQLEAVNNNPVISGGIVIKLEWKFDFTEGTNTNRGAVRFWKSAEKTEQIVPSNEWRYTPLNLEGPGQVGEAYSPYVEGIEPSRNIFDAGTASYALRFTMNDGSVIVFTYKPIKLSVTPVLKNLSTDASLDGAEPLTFEYSPTFMNNKVFGTINIDTEFYRTTVGQQFNYVQFLFDCKNLTPDNYAITYINGAELPVKYVIDNVATNPYPVKDFPFIDGTPQTVLYNMDSTLSTVSGELSVKMSDSPAMQPLLRDAETVHARCEFNSFCVLSTTNQVNGINVQILYPIARNKWSIEFHLTNIQYSQQVPSEIVSANFNDSGVSGYGYTVVHEFALSNGVQGKVTPAIATHTVVLRDQEEIADTIFSGTTKRYRVFD